MSLACRNCRVPIAAETGCAICEPLKRHLVAVDETEDDRPSLSEVGSSVVADLQYARRMASKIMRDDTADADTRLAATGRILKIGNTAAKVLEAARKLQTDGISAIQAMSFAERAKIYVEWYCSLPPAYREQLRRKQTEFEGEIQRALPPAVS